jgi:hypothetical protein
MDILYNNIGVWNWDSYLTNVSDHLIANEKKKNLQCISNQRNS